MTLIPGGVLYWRYVGFNLSMFIVRNVVMN